MTFLFILKYKFTKHISIHVALSCKKEAKNVEVVLYLHSHSIPWKTWLLFFCHLFYQKTCGLVFQSMFFKEALGCVFCWVFRVCFLRKHAAAYFALYVTMAYISLSNRNKINAKKRGRVQKARPHTLPPVCISNSNKMSKSGMVCLRKS